MGKGECNGQARLNPQWLIDEVKAELAADRLKKVVPVWRDLREGHVVVSPRLEPSMTIRVDRDVRPVLKNCNIEG